MTTKTFATIGFDVHSIERDVVTLRDYSAKDKSLSYKRTAPKRQKDNPGTERSELKLTVINPQTGDIIGIVRAETAISAASTDAQKTLIKGIFRAAVADSGWDDLIGSQRLPATP